MRHQPKYIPLRGSTFSAMAGGRGRRWTEQSREDSCAPTGCFIRKAGVGCGTISVPDRRRVMARGQERFDIFCSPCHSHTGLGDGMVVRRGYRRPPSYHQDRLREAPVGHFFDVITNGSAPCPIRRAGRRRRSLGDRRLHPRAATQRARHARRRPAGRAGRIRDAVQANGRRGDSRAGAFFSGRLLIAGAAGVAGFARGRVREHDAVPAVVPDGVNAGTSA